MSRIRIFTAALVLGTSLAGCMTPNTNALTSTQNPSLYSVHQPVVARNDYVLDLRADGGAVSRAEIERLHGWFDAIGLRYGDRISIDEGYGAGSARSDIAAAVAEYGLRIDDAAPVTPGQVPAGSVRVVASRTTASVPGCPDWAPEDNGVSPRQNTSSNYGCATNANLAAMIADPNDLVLGQAGSVYGDAATSTKAIRVWRQTEPTGTKGLSNVSTKGN